MRYECIAYYQGPEIRRGILDCIFRKPGNIIYRVSPQIYLSNLSDPLAVLDVLEVEFAGGISLSIQYLEATLTERVRSSFGSGVAISKRGIIIPAENIDIKIQEHIED
ncbi:hypothetical protein J4216_00410 [Candidatus Woesearchaeota archaeon]|nr:hypothetical protein [Candidatus Woesearchaeota archaeon]